MSASPQLPFLIVHGAVTAKLLVAACAGAGVAAVGLVRRRRQARDDRDLARMRAALASTRLAAGTAMVRGRLRGTASTLTEIPGETFDPKHERTSNLALDVDDQCVDLVGDVYVASGTSSAARGILRTRRWFAVSDGDDVVVSGAVTQLSPGRWRMSAPLELVAMQPRARARRLGPFALAATLAVFAAIGYGGLSWLGSALREHDGRNARTADLSLAMQLAAALPHARDAALEDADWQLSWAPRSEPTIQQRLALADLRAGCAGRARLLAEEDRFETLLATARGCDTGADVTALATLGRYNEAADRLFREPALVESNAGEAVIVAVGAGRWADAADAADRVADALAAESAHATNTTPFIREYEANRILATRCIADWFRTRSSAAVAPAGRSDAVARLDALGQGSSVTGCALGRALVLPADQRTAALTAIAGAKYGAHDGDGSDIARALLDAADTPRSLHDGLGHDPLAWLAPPAVFAYARALRALTVGELADATIAARTLRDADADTRTELLARIALRTPQQPLDTTIPEWTDLNLADAISLRNGTLAVTSMPAGDDSSAIAAALRGDGGPLAARLLGVNILDRIAVLGVLPRVTTHRTELVEALRLFEPNWLNADPFEVVGNAAIRRDLLRLAGARADAEPWQRIVLAQLAMLADRDKLLALLLWRR